MRYQTGKISNLIKKWITELSNLKHPQLYMTFYDLEYRRFERQPQSNQLYLTFTPKLEEIFETIETADININSYQSLIEPIIDRNFKNTFQHHNGPNKRQHTHKNTSQQYQHKNTRQQYQYRNIIHMYQHRNTSQQYQSISFQISRISSIPYLK